MDNELAVGDVCSSLLHLRLISHLGSNPTPLYKPGTSPRRPVTLYHGGGAVENARKANLARKQCKKAKDCNCPTHPGAKIVKSTSCINGLCECDNKAIRVVHGKPTWVQLEAQLGSQLE